MRNFGIYGMTVLACAGCVAEEAPFADDPGSAAAAARRELEPGLGEPPASYPDESRPGFALEVNEAEDTAAIVEQIATAAGATLRRHCEREPNGIVLVASPIASGGVRCAALLSPGLAPTRMPVSPHFRPDRAGPQMPEREMPASFPEEGHGSGGIGWSPVGLACSVLMFSSSAFAYELEVCDAKHGDKNDVKRQRELKRCRDLLTYGLGGLGVVCAFI
jgi:hypothetical protein